MSAEVKGIFDQLTELEEQPIVSNILWIGIIGGSIWILLQLYFGWKSSKEAALRREMAQAEPPAPSIPPQDMTVEQLKEYNGSDHSKPILIGVDNVIFDVTRGKHFYGPGKAYALFAGRDASRALAKSSFDEENLNDASIDSLTA